MGGFFASPGFTRLYMWLNTQDPNLYQVILVIYFCVGAECIGILGAAGSDHGHQPAA